MHNQKIIKSLLLVSRFFLGAVFIFSGFVKGVDPMGSAYKFMDYFTAFHMDFLDPLAIFLAFLLPALEFLMGISLMFRFRFRLGAWVVALFMVVFTGLTLILALTDPVRDCGCFGDAILLSNWETFFKNLVLLPFVLIVFSFRNHSEESWTVSYAWGGLAAFAILFLSLQVHAIRHLPPLDFRPYSVGTYIPDKMSIPEGAPRDEYQTLLYYEKNGEVREFTEEDFPWDDSTWTYVDTENKLIRKGYEPLIHDFTMVDESGIDHVGALLDDMGYSFLLVSVQLEKADPDILRKADELASWCLASGHSFYCLSSSIDEEIERIRDELGLGFGIYTADEITLKTIVRSNPGLLLLEKGTIMAKWHYRDMPGWEDFRNGIPALLMNDNRIALEKRAMFSFAALFLLLATIISLNPYRRNNTK